jgi:L,D-transpeptidase YcbB
MIRSRLLKSAVVLAAALVGPVVEHARAADGPAFASDAAIAQPPQSAPDAPISAAIGERLAALPVEGTAEEIKDRATLIDFYQRRDNAPLWVTPGGLAKAASLVREIKNAGDWGLDADAFKLPDLPVDADTLSSLAPVAVADAEVTLAVAVLKYARHARGGRVIDPTILLNSNLDRKPQLLDPGIVLGAITGAQEPDAYLRSLHPKQPQFEKLRQAYLAAKNKTLSDKLRANMEEWRWMPEDLGELHILANVPAFMVYLVKDGVPIHSERIVVGEVGKQTTIFTRNLKTIVFKPMWRVPESIKVRELQPNLRYGGGNMFRQYDLQLETKDGRPLDYRIFDWSTTDIRNYEVVQPPGPKNVMGVVKFTFPSQHTIFMHDTIDKWMFERDVRTLSHGCLRLRDPMRMAEMVLAEDKGWDAERVRKTLDEGPRNNEIVIDHEIPVHLVYFTAWVDEGGLLRTYRDIYGHEKRITQALQGKWDQINVGRDHLAPVQPVPVSKTPTASRNASPVRSVLDMVGRALGGSF